ncbi:hypothetical protein PANA5342_3045 [Pantoea ananatis LMG 5342]|nr:hypothetical protein PANA5342_3045 [Pantoea ananatis LMG 5342]
MARTYFNVPLPPAGRQHLFNAQKQSHQDNFTASEYDAAASPRSACSVVGGLCLHSAQS